jgi:hypothetical protein
MGTQQMKVLWFRWSLMGLMTPAQPISEQMEPSITTHWSQKQRLVQI